MNIQPKALRLADELDVEFAQGRISNHNGRKAAAELRRLHEVNQELLEALKMGLEIGDGMPRGFLGEFYKQASAVIAKGEQV